MLKSFGCSFVFGTDLADDGRGHASASASQLTWPAHLARHFEHDYICYARPGAGNLSIADRVLSHAASPGDDIYVINWTYIDRFDYGMNQTPWDRDWSTLRPGEKSEENKFYFTHLQGDYRDKLSALITIKTCIDTLVQRNIPFIMTYMDHLMFDTQYHCSPAISLLQQQAKQYLRTFQGSNFVEWSRDHGYAISDTEHPLEQAHEAAAKHIIANQSDFFFNFTGVHNV